MNTIFDALRESHEKQKLLLNALTETTAGYSTRELFYTMLKEELEQHAAAEERCFYAPLIESDRTIDMSRHGIAEHHALDKLIAQLDETDFASPQWMPLLKKLQHAVTHHLEEEEQRFFQQAGKVFSDKEKTALANEYEKEMAS
ncbi:hemerythrin domain-containing protein [Thalassotalea euphylliae]|uniref:hemerythrin domain-containing protein n=1 Tax=Thalassotalea euphylliae TaxID=1655234 RepID=UPI00363D48BB